MFFTFLTANCIVRLRYLLLTRLDEPGAFRPIHNTIAFSLAHPIMVLYFSLHTCFASVVCKSIYMHFTHMCNICQEASDICSYFHSDLLNPRLLPPFGVYFAFLDTCLCTFKHILSGEQQEEIDACLRGIIGRYHLDLRPRLSDLYSGYCHFLPYHRSFRQTRSLLQPGNEWSPPPLCQALQ